LRQALDPVRASPSFSEIVLSALAGILPPNPRSSLVPNYPAVDGFRNRRVLVWAYRRERLVPHSIAGDICYMLLDHLRAPEEFPAHCYHGIDTLFLDVNRMGEYKARAYIEGAA
jgi:hypothetical protein